jgi:16S rRNA (cytidine1402-2'-O)-methyltransferase
LERLAALVLEGATLTLVFYEAPHRILETLEDIETTWGAACPVVVAREVTKLHEEFLRGAVAQVRAELAGRERVRGEITLLVEAKPKMPDAAGAGSSLKERVAELQRAEGLDEMAALKRAARERGVSKSEAYRELQRTRIRR